MPEGQTVPQLPQFIGSVKKSVTGSIKSQTRIIRSLQGRYHKLDLWEMKRERKVYIPVIVLVQVGAAEDEVEDDAEEEVLDGAAEDELDGAAELEMLEAAADEDVDEGAEDDVELADPEDVGA